MASSQDLKALQEDVQKCLVSTVKSANRIASEDLRFQRTVNPDAATQLDEGSARMLELASQLLQSAAKACGVKSPSLEDAEDIDLNWRSIVDVVDSVLEKADTAMDEYTGLVKRKEPPAGETGPKQKRPKTTGKVIRNANIAKPQTLFDEKPNNFPTGPWRPVLTQKPHASVALDESLELINTENGVPQYKHPYETEISHMTYPERMFQRKEPIPPQPIESTEAVWVDTFEGVLEMLRDLKQATEIAVDLEHHDFRTYTGLVCLMQVSTRAKDWIVDTLQPWRQKLEILNEVFADPNIVKVFHGAYMDMVWLQRDLGLYVNGLFDTYFACDLLRYPGKSLAFLLSKFADFDADKQYQLADWRIRPIPEAMLFYARSDTHYLLYIYDHVRNELIEASSRSQPDQDLLSQALERSKELALSRHEHPDFRQATGEGSRGWHNYVLKNSHLALSGEQFSIFKALWEWRDDTARKEDESPNFVLGNNGIIEISRVNPPDVKALHSLLPLTAPLARASLNQIWSRVQEAKAKGGPSLLEFFQSLTPDAKTISGFPRVTRDRGQLPLQLPQPDAQVSVSRTSQSRLFGIMPISSRWETSGDFSSNLEDIVPFPWQRFVQETADPKDLEMGDGIEDEELPKADPPGDGPEGPITDDEEFTLRQGRRKQAEPEQVQEVDTSQSSEDDGESAQEHDQDGDGADVIAVVETAPQKSKKQRKLERKLRKEQDVERAKKREAKLLRKTQKQAKRAKSQEEQQKKYQAVPFDYSAAASVMHASKNNTEKKEQKKVFDPYAKTADEDIKAAAKMPRIKGERSATFRN